MVNTVDMNYKATRHKTFIALPTETVFYVATNSLPPFRHDETWPGYVSEDEKEALYRGSIMGDEWGPDFATLEACWRLLQEYGWYEHP